MNHPVYAAPDVASKCNPLHPLSCTPGAIVKDVTGDLAGGVASSVSGSVLDQVGQAVGQAVGQVLASLGTVWVRIPTAGLIKPATIEWAQSTLWFYMSCVAVGGVLAAGARMAWHARGRDLQDLARSLMQLVLVAGGSVAVVTLLLQVGDGFSTWVLHESGGGAGFGRRLGGLFASVTATATVAGTVVGGGNTGLATAGGSVGLSTLLVIIVGVLAICQSLIQIALMILRAAALVVLVGVWPLSAAATHTERGKQWFDRLTGWIIAFVLYKPVAALIYATGFKMAGSEKGLVGAVIGLALMAMALIALPALMRLAVPAVAALGSGGGGAAGGAALGSLAGSALSRGPSGAKQVPTARAAHTAAAPDGPRGGGHAGGSGGGAGPSGASSPSRPGPTGSPGSNGSRGGMTGGMSGGMGGGAAGGAGGSAGATGAAGGGAAGGAAAGGAAAGAGAVAGPVGAAVVGAQVVYGKARETIDDATSGGPSGTG